jgi:hypothetical protein
MKVLAATVLFGLTVGCGKAGKTSGPGDVSQGEPNFGPWREIVTGTHFDLFDVSMGKKLFAVGEAGTMITSTDQGKTWSTQETGVQTDLVKIKWVNNVMFVCGVDAILISKDHGQTFTPAKGIKGRLNDIEWTSSLAHGSNFWAVGAAGLVLKAKIPNQDLEQLDPDALVWQQVDVGHSGDLTGVSFSFERGLIIGKSGFIVQTQDMGSTFEPVPQVETSQDLLTIDDEVIGGDRVLLKREPISGMPVGSYRWLATEDSSWPQILGLHCLSDCLAVGRHNGSSAIFTIKGEDVLETEAANIPYRLHAITNMFNKAFIAVGGNGKALVKSISP